MITVLSVRPRSANVTSCAQNLHCLCCLGTEVKDLKEDVEEVDAGRSRRRAASKAAQKLVDSDSEEEEEETAAKPARKRKRGKQDDSDEEFRVNEEESDGKCCLSLL